MTRTSRSNDRSRLKVGVLAPLSWRVPPRAYGPWEQFVSLLTEGLVQRGVSVTLFATGDSSTNATLSSVVSRGYSEDPTMDVKVAEGLHLASFFERSGEFDLLHNSYDFLPLCFSGLVQTPMVTTVHGFSSEKILPVYQRYNSQNHFVSISDADRHSSLDYAATIRHGIDFSQFPLGLGSRDYLLFFGRIHPDKGTREAIEAARRAQMPLVIAGIIQDEKYFETAIAPHIDGSNVRYVGVVESEKKAKLLGGARALLHLINFDEPFGFSVVEAMACGTPVIATKRGSMEELIVHGTNGFLIEHGEPAPIFRPGEFDPQVVRESVATRFSHDRMVDEYVALYHNILNTPPAK
jgi:glycosyltransferase involved in cell wall biosynthesis